jgi:hypothetical protein
MDTSRVRSRVRTRTHGAVGRRRLRPPLTRYKIKGHPTRRQVISSNLLDSLRGVAIFAKACFGHPSPSKRQKLNATANAFGAPIRPRHLVPTGLRLLNGYVSREEPCTDPYARCCGQTEATAAENPGNVALAK